MKSTVLTDNKKLEGAAPKQMRKNIVLDYADTMQVLPISPGASIFTREILICQQWACKEELRKGLWPRF